VVIQPYRGYGTLERIFLMGRVFHQPRMGAGRRGRTVGRDVLDIVRRIVRRGLGNVELTVRFAGAQERILTDRDGYFRLQMSPQDRPPQDREWHEVELELPWKGGSIVEIGEVFIPPAGARRVIISDIDDTVMRTGVANTFLMLYRLFAQGAESRTAFPGVAALYRALHHGPTGDEQNLMLYVSRGPWSIYEMLDRFFDIHRIPVGPILFLREWGVTLQRPLPRRATDHKIDLIREMVERYEDLPFVLIGDSGQHDPEIYGRVVAEHPGRVVAVYIRDVSRKAERRGEIGALAREVERAGSPLVLADDTFAMAEHAARAGLLSDGRLAEVLAEREEEEAAAA